VRYVESARYATTNNAYSLWAAREHLDADTFVLDGDVVFESELARRLAAAPGPAASAVSRWREGMNGTAAVVDGGRVTAIVPAADGEVVGSRRKTVNVHLLRSDYARTEFVPMLDELIACGGEREFYERVLARSVLHGTAVAAVDCSDLRWFEVDDQGDRIVADYLFAEPAERSECLAGLHGGYWRFDIADHCLMTNPYFPTPALLRQLADDLPAYLTHYPLGRTPVQEALSAVVELPAGQLVVANGASELISALGRVLEHPALVVPGFNEYEAAFAATGFLPIALEPPGFGLNVTACAQEAAQHGCTAVVLTSPNNPTSLAIPREDLLLLAKLLATRSIRLVVDESFVDFCGGEYSVADELAGHRNLAVVKSMSKAYGVGGLRLGYLATADAQFAARMRAQLPIWNINGLAEAFLVRLPGFRAEYRDALDRVRADRDELYAMLCRIPGVKVLEPDANFVLIRLPHPWTGPDVAARLLARDGILVKECSGKNMPDAAAYLRISCLTGRENQRLVAALQTIMDEPSFDGTVVDGKVF
jgi:histidinol-phosphate/aromatic aminotransferase/cobyric acid decarboxylase-like protein/choline kinase